MLYESTKVLLSDVPISLETAGKIRWDDEVELASECSNEMHQMARPLYQGYRTDRGKKVPVLVPVFEGAARAVPHVKPMVRALRREDQVAALQGGRAAPAKR